MSMRYETGQRVSVNLGGCWRHGRFVCYAELDGRQQCIVRVARNDGKPGRLHYTDQSNTARTVFDSGGNPVAPPVFTTLTVTAAGEVP